jgi:hypothetical protein
VRAVIAKDVKAMKRSNQYEAAFEAYLQWQGLCYVAVDETRRSLLGDVSLKSLDFIVHGAGTCRLLIDVKGRRFPALSKGRPRCVWECWSTAEDIHGLERWAELFGPGYQGLLVFTYQLLPTVTVPEDTDDLWSWRDNRYLFRAMTVADYHKHMRVRSPRWGTVGLPGSVFRALVRPLHHFTCAQEPVPEECPF